MHIHIYNIYIYTLQDLLSGEFHEVILSNYMVDWWFLTGAVPRLKTVPVTVLCSAGEQDRVEVWFVAT